jgi:hypothetical protein
MASNQQVTSTRSTGIPVYSGSEILAFSVAQMPPGIRIYSYVNGQNVTPFTAPTTEGARIADPIFTDQLGSAVGYLYIPSTDGQYKFPSGEIRLTFGDSPNGIEFSKFISETTLYNHGLNLVDTEQGTTVALRSTEKIRTSITGTSNEKNTTQKRLDPLSQSFVVDAVKYPLGVVVTGINLFFYKKDDKLPVAIELRPMVGGVPSTTEYFSGSYIVKSPQDVSVYSETGGAPSTAFTFQHPIFLKPGEYAFCVMTKSDKYELLTAKVGEGRTVKQPFAGTLFKPQNTGNWVGDRNEDLTFIIRKAKFETGTSVFELETPELPGLEYNKFRLLSTEVNFGDTAYATYRIQTTTAGTNQKSDFQDVLTNSEPLLRGRMVANSQGDIKVEVSLTTKSADVSPILDKQLIKGMAFRNLVRPYTQEISNSELNARHGSAVTRYLSKVVALQEGFDSTGIQVQVDVNRKVGTDIEVFARVLGRNDKALTAGINDRPFVRLPLVSPTSKSFAGTSDDDFTTETYKLLEPELSYTYSANTFSSNVLTNSYFDTFAYYQVKIVFYASNPVYLPKIKNMIATSLL